jgi:hypothetical protein
MHEQVIKYLTKNFNLDEITARKIFHDFQKAYNEALQDQEPRRFRQPAAPAAGGLRPEPTRPGERERPPAREVDPFWYFTNAWQVLEPTIAWPLGVYQMAKMGMAATAGIPAAAALPRKLGGMSARELWGAVRNPTSAQQWQSYYKLPRAQRLAFNRPTVRPPTPGTGTGLGAVPPRVLGVSSWMPAAGTIAAIVPPAEPGRIPPRTIAPTEGRCPPGYTLTTTGRCVAAQALE